MNLIKRVGFICLLVWSFFLALGWLIPNHTLPWTSFHSEIWVAILLSAITPFLIVKAPSHFSCDGLLSLLAITAAIPFIQFSFCQINYFGHAWICSIYLVGLLVSILTGRFWESSHPGRLIDMLSLAIGIGALFSVGLELYQWLELDGLGIWLMDSSIARPYANLGQPNQLATFLVWGVLATFWGVIRSKFGLVAAIPLALIMLFGIALTGSRTAWVAIVLITLAIWWWRKLWEAKCTPWVITGLGVYFVCCVLVLNFLGASDRIKQLAIAPADVRFSAWKLLIGAALEKPLFGYGWGQVAEAQISVSLNYPALHVIFIQSHNLFLDLVLWCGLPIGLLLSFALLRWFWIRFRKVDSPKNAVLFLFLLAVANHAMLEFPLQYAYFLLPTGLIMGAIVAHDKDFRPLIVVSKGYFAALWLLSVVMLSVTVIDYLKVEHKYSLLRLEWAGYKLELDPQPPSVIALSQWHHIIKSARAVPKMGMSESELEEMRRVVTAAHKPLDFLKLAMALDLNGKSGEAELWLERLCSVETEKNCLLAKEEFKKTTEKLVTDHE